LAYLESHPEAGAVVASVNRFDTNVHESVRFLAVDDATLQASSPADFLVHTWVNQSAVVVRAPVAKTTPYPTHTGDSEDMIQAVELRLTAGIGAVPDTLAYYRHHPHQATRRVDHMFKSLQTRLNWAREHYARLGYASPGAAMEPILRHAVERTTLHYWSRDITQFRHERDQILRLWPDGVPIPREFKRAVPPAFLLRLRDRVLG
jgi:hypothetical protein